jgi:hypothetical protein
MELGLCAMIAIRRPHRTDDRQLVGLAAEHGEEVAHLRAAVTAAENAAAEL